MLSGIARASVAVIAVFGILPAVNCWAECPQSCVYFSFAPAICTTESAIDTSLIGGCGDHAQFDIAAGTLSATTSAGLNNCYCTTEVTDAFRVEGVPPGTPIVLDVQMNVKISLVGPSGSCGGFGELTAPDGTLARFDFTPSPKAPLPPPPWRDSVVTASVEVFSGDWFELTFAVGTDGSEAEATSEAYWSFGGLPLGAGVRSCNGYYQQGVQVQSVTWGSLKAIYR
jgi:hypothetical protein